MLLHNSTLKSPHFMHPLKRLWVYARTYHRIIKMASLYSFLNKLFDIAPEVLIGIAVDTVVKRQASFLGGLGFADLNQQLLVLGVITFIIWALESTFQYCYDIKWRKLAQNLQHDLRLDTYDHIQQLEMSYFEDKHTGEILSVLNEDVNQLERFLDGGANNIIQIISTVVLIGGIFFYISPRVALFCIVPVPIIIYGGFYFQKRLLSHYTLVREKSADLLARMNQSFAGISVIKSFTSEKWELEQIKNLSQNYQQANLSAIRLSSAFIPIIRIAIVAGFIATLVVGGQQVFAGHLEVASYSILIFLTQRLLWPLTNLAQTADLYQRALASIKRIFSLLDTPIKIISGTRDFSHHPLKGEIDFNDITFHYQHRPVLFKQLNLKIAAGTTVGFVGTTGSGKSSLIKLLLRFYDPQSGKITIDHEDISQLEIKNLRLNIGLVSQDVFLFSGTVAENISYGNPQAALQDILAAAHLAEAHSFITQLPQGYDTIIGERGQKLSGGQKQRLSIARALLKNPPILILDEATSAVDNETEALIQKSLEKIVVGRTTLIIAHRLSTLRHCDCIYVFDQGQVVEQGTHDSLVAAGGIYSNLWQVQIGQIIF